MAAIFDCAGKLFGLSFRLRFKLSDKIIVRGFHLSTIILSAGLISLRITPTFKSTKWLRRYGGSAIVTLCSPVYMCMASPLQVDGQEKIVAIFLHDNYARQYKHSGAWMNSFRNQYIDENGESVVPIVINNNNFNKG